MIRKATIQDVKAIRDLINSYADKGEMLPRAMGELYDCIRDFHVYDKNGVVLGVVALHVGWDGLAEVRSVAVSQDITGRGVGRRLVAACLKEAKALRIKKVFVLTYVPEFFVKLGFEKSIRSKLPQKIWTECQNKCVKYPDKCNETALTLSLD